MLCPRAPVLWEVTLALTLRQFYCTRNGYVDPRAHLLPSLLPESFGNLLLGGFGGNADIIEHPVVQFRESASLRLAFKREPKGLAKTSNTRGSGRRCFGSMYVMFVVMFGEQEHLHNFSLFTCQTVTEPGFR